jgi:hypothetical protein
MRRLWIIPAVLVVAAAAYLVVVWSFGRQVQNQTAALKSGGHAVSLADLARRSSQDQSEVIRLLGRADSLLARQDEPLLMSADSGGATEADVRQVVGRNAAVIDLLLAASRHPEGYRDVPYEDGMTARLPRFMKREVDFGRLLRAHARALAGRGEYDRALGVLTANLRLTDLMKDDILIVAMVQDMEFARVLRLMREYAPRAGAVAMREALDAVNGLELHDRHARALDVDVEMARDHLARRRSADFIYGMAGSSKFWLRLATDFPPTNLAAQRDFLRVMSRQVALFAQPSLRSGPGWDSLDAETRTLATRSPLASVYVPHYRTFASRRDAVQASRDITALGLQTLLDTRARGKAPDQLDQTLIDPFSGQPYRYRPGPGGFAVYSLGKDGKDDGGDPASDIAWEVKR